MASRVPARFSRPWLALWIVNTLVLAALLIATVTPAVWLSVAFVMFGLPEMIGLLHRGDSLPPLTYAVRRYAPRWMVDTSIWALAAWAAISWWHRPHHVLIAVAIAAIVAWLTNHFDVTYDGPGE